MRRAAREPTLHFLLIAGAMFLVSALVGPDRGRVVVVDPARVEARVARIEAQGGRTLTPEERELVWEAYITEQVLVREARAMGLDADPRIDDLLAKKMLHVLSAEVIQPSEGELAAWYAANRGRYTPPATAAVDEVVVRGDDPADPEDARHSRRVLRDVDRDDLRRLFDDATADAVFHADPGVWLGPYPSVRGEHWLRVRERTRPEPPELDAVRPRVRRDWIQEREEERLEARVRELRSRYRVRTAR